MAVEADKQAVDAWGCTQCSAYGRVDDTCNDPLDAVGNVRRVTNKQNMTTPVGGDLPGRVAEPGPPAKPSQLRPRAVDCAQRPDHLLAHANQTCITSGQTAAARAPQAFAEADRAFELLGKGLPYHS